uniref:Reverse transcriptase domain-containing protein n=1 Tax=Lactuca sativa TaxID=4236 RepID=A0A9R1XDH7_LACSA|nr:hypothetical protein LSAT_V11C400207670 [Lactuca sativa]
MGLIHSKSSSDGVMSKAYITTGISFTNNDMLLSHLMYGDDVNIVSFNKLLICFHVASGLKVNLQNSKVYGGGVEDNKIEILVDILNAWKAKNLSFGGILTLVKLVLTSISLYYFSLFKGPKKLLMFLKGRYDTHKQSCWVACEKTMHPKKYRRIEVGGFRILNLALLFKCLGG